MPKTWMLEMHNPDHGSNSLISTNSFDHFSEVARTIKLNREMLFVVEPPNTPLASDLLALNELQNEGLKIKRKPRS